MSLPMLIWIAITEALCVNAGDGNKQLFKSFISKVDCLLRLVKHQMVSSRGREMFTKVYQWRLLKCLWIQTRKSCSRQGVFLFASCGEIAEQLCLLRTQDVVGRQLKALGLKSIIGLCTDISVEMVMQLSRQTKVERL